MHLVETEIESERCPGSEPQPLASYMRFARNLPSLFDDHTWVADLGDGTPVGCGACWSNSAGDAGHMESYVYVRRPMRRRGVGSALAREVLRTAIEEGRSSISWSTYDTIPAGESFSKSLGGSVGRVSRNSELQVARLDLNQLDSWIASARLRAPGYRLQFWDGPYSNELLGAAANFHRLMNTQPRDAMATGDIRIDADHVAELDRALQESWPGSVDCVRAESKWQRDWRNRGRLRTLGASGGATNEYSDRSGTPRPWLGEVGKGRSPSTTSPGATSRRDRAHRQCILERRDARDQRRPRI